MTISKHLKKIIDETFPNQVGTFLIDEIFEREIYDFESDTDTPVIVDCGANIGLSVFFFKSKFPNSSVHALEPDSYSFQQLENNIRDLGLSNVKLINKAAAGDSKSRLFFSSENNVPVMSFSENPLAQKRTKVACINFGNFIKQLGEVDFCKMDIEGAESEVIDSLLDCNTLTLVKQFKIEYHCWVKQKYSLSELVKQFEDQKFTCSLTSNNSKEKRHPMDDNIMLNAIRN